MTGKLIIPLEQSMKELTLPPVIELYSWEEIKSVVSVSGNQQSTSVDGITISSKLKKYVCGKVVGFVGVLLDIVITGSVHSFRNFCNWKIEQNQRIKYDTIL